MTAAAPHVPTRADATAVTARFAVPGSMLSLEPHTSGLINHSWVATFATPAGRRRYVLQQINRHVFHHPDEVMENMVRVTRHVAARLAREGAPDAGRRVLSFVPTHEGVSHHVDAAGETWRLVPWVEGTRATERASTEARGPGDRPRLRPLPGPPRATCPAPPLHETILAFHDTPGRLVAFEQAVAADRVSRASGCRREIDALLDRRPLASALAEPAARGEIPVRPTHNDAKIANVLFDETTGEGLCVVDLDTVMPGPRLVRLRRPRPLDGERLGRGRAGPRARRASASPSSRRSPAASSRGPATRSPPPSARSSSPARRSSSTSRPSASSATTSTATATTGPPGPATTSTARGPSSGCSSRSRRRAPTWGGSPRGRARDRADR